MTVPPSRARQVRRGYGVTEFFYIPPLHFSKRKGVLYFARDYRLLDKVHRVCKIKDSIYATALLEKRDIEDD